MVPVTDVSRLAEHAVAQALSISCEVIAVTVAVETDDTHDGIVELQHRWRRWDPGVPLEVLSTEYSSVAAPVVSFVNSLRSSGREQVVVLIPTVVPWHLRYRLLHNQLDLVLSDALRTCPGVVVARVPMAIPTMDGG